MTQSFFVAEAQTGRKGKFVPIKTTVSDVKQILEGQVDDINEEKLMFLGELSEARSK
jgi:F-type H+-transporting ATPase subunit beta